MAQRDLNNYRQVTNVAAEQTGQLVTAVADVTGEIVRQNEEAKMTEGASAVQLELNKLQNQYQIDYEGDPMGGFEKFKQARQKLFDQYGSTISPMYRRNWNEGMRKLSAQNDVALQAWGLKQTRVNTVNSVNTSMQNYLQQAAMDGELYGSGQGDLNVVANMANSVQSLEEFGNKNLGSETTKEMMQKYRSDYIKTFISGTLQQNPARAAELMKRPEVRDAFDDPQKYLSMVEAIDSRVEREARKAERLAGLNKVGGAIELYNNSNELSYSDLQEQMDRLGIEDESARNYFLAKNGYKLPRGVDKTVSDEMRDEVKLRLYGRLVNAGKTGDMSDEEIAAMQKDIFAAGEIGALTAGETDSWINQLLVPVVEQKRKQVESFSDNDKWYTFKTDIGLLPLEEEFERTKITAPEGKKLGATAERFNAKNKIKLYDSYMQSLEYLASKQGKTMQDVMDLPQQDKRAFMAAAQAEAIKAYNSSNYPEVARMSKPPTAVLPAVPRNVSPVRVTNKAEYDALQSGTLYIAPDGKTRTKP